MKVNSKHGEKAQGECRTKRVVLKLCDALAESTRTGHAFVSPLDPASADPRCYHPPRPVI